MRPLILFFLWPISLVGWPAYGKSDVIERYQDWALWSDIDPMGQTKTQYFINAIAKVKTKEADTIYERPGKQAIAQLTVECGNLVQLYVKHDKRIYGRRTSQVRAVWISGEKNESHPIYAASPAYAGTLLRLDRDRHKPTLMALMKRWEEVMIEIASDNRYVYLPFSLRGFTKASKALADKCKSRPKQNLRVYKYGESPKKVSP